MQKNPSLIHYIWGLLTILNLSFEENTSFSYLPDVDKAKDEQFLQAACSADTVYPVL